jgi:nitrate reductase gamma subunit
MVHAVYQLASGPLVWLAFSVFVLGMIYRFFTMGRLAAKKDPVVFSYMSFFYALRSIFHWIIPYASVNMRKHPVMTAVAFAFHICLFAVPIFLCAHIVLIHEAWQVSWVYLPNTAADIMTLIVIGSCVFFLCRRLVLHDVRYLTTPSDFFILAAVAAPFITGFWSYHQLPGHVFAGLIHILSGELMLAIIPFTRLSHMLFFPFTRGYAGSEFGAVRNARDW